MSFPIGAEQPGLLQAELLGGLRDAEFVTIQSETMRDVFDSVHQDMAFGPGTQLNTIDVRIPEC